MSEVPLYQHQHGRHVSILTKAVSEQDQSPTHWFVQVLAVLDVQRHIAARYAHCAVPIWSPCIPPYEAHEGV